MNEKAEYTIILKSGQFTSELKKTEGEMDAFEGKLKGIGSTIGATFAVGALVSFGREAVKTSAKLESLRNAITFSSGSAQEGAKNLEYIESISKRLGFELISTTEGFKTFSGALIGSKFEGEKARDIFTKISYGISTMGLSADDAKGSFLALGQMVSKGTVSAEELRGQLGERLPGAFQIAARALGVTTSKLGDMLKKGEVITEDFLPKFADEMEKTFKGGTEKASEGLTASLNRIQNRITGFTDFVGHSLSPIIVRLGSDTKSASDQFLSMKDNTDSLKSSLEPLVNEYLELKELSTLNGDQQDRLKEVINNIADLMPTAVTAWDKYGNAIDISNEKLKTHLSLSQDALRVKNKEAIKETQDAIKQEEINSKRYQAALNKVAKEGIFGGGKVDALDEKGRANLTEYLSEIRGKLELSRLRSEELKQSLSSLKGEPIKKQEVKEVSGVTKKENLFEKIFEGFSDEAAKSSRSKLKGLFKTLSEEEKTDKISDLFKELSPMSVSNRIQRINEMAEKNKGKDVSGVEKIQSGTRNITINITKLVENVNISKTLDKMGNSEMVDAIKRALLTATNDVNIMAGS